MGEREMRMVKIQSKREISWIVSFEGCVFRYRQRTSNMITDILLILSLLSNRPSFTLPCKSPSNLEITQLYFGGPFLLERKRYPCGRQYIIFTVLYVCFERFFETCQFGVINFNFSGLASVSHLLWIMLKSTNGADQLTIISIHPPPWTNRREIWPSTTPDGSKMATVRNLVVDFGSIQNEVKRSGWKIWRQDDSIPTSSSESDVSYVVRLLFCSAKRTHKSWRLGSAIPMNFVRSVRRLPSLHR